MQPILSYSNLHNDHFICLTFICNLYFFFKKNSLLQLFDTTIVHKCILLDVLCIVQAYKSFFSSFVCLFVYLYICITNISNFACALKPVFFVKLCEFSGIFFVWDPPQPKQILEQEMKPFQVSTFLLNFLLLNIKVLPSKSLH